MKINALCRFILPGLLVASLVGLSAAAVRARVANRFVPAAGRAPIVLIGDDDNDDSSSSGRGYLGVSVQRLRNRLRESFDIPDEIRGLIITDVSDDSPADEAGLRNRDVILKFDGKAIDDEDDFIEAVRATKPGTKSTLSVWHDGKTRDVTVTLGKRPTPMHVGAHSWSWSGDDWDHVEIPPIPAIPRMSHFFNVDGMGHRMMRSGGRLGIEVQDLNKEIAPMFGVSDDHGALVWRVIEDTPAEKAGLKAGDVIVEIEGRSIRDGQDLRETLADYDAGDTVAVSYLRKGQAGSVKIELAERDSPAMFMYSDDQTPKSRSKGAHGADLDHSMERIQREMESLNRRMDDLRREMERLKD